MKLFEKFKNGLELLLAIFRRTKYTIFVNEYRPNEWDWEVKFDNGETIGRMPGNWKSSKESAIASARIEVLDVCRANTHLAVKTLFDAVLKSIPKPDTGCKKVEPFVDRGWEKV